MCTSRSRAHPVTWCSSAGLGVARSSSSRGEATTGTRSRALQLRAEGGGVPVQHDPRPRSCPTSSAGVPVARTRPASSTTTWSASSAASWVWCVVSRSVVPCSRSSRISSCTASLACGSSPAVGSSSSRTSGRPTSAVASARRCRSPPDSRRTRPPPEGRQAQSVGELAEVARPGVHRGDVAQHLSCRHGQRQPAVLEHHADPGAQRAVVRRTAEHLDLAAGRGAQPDHALHEAGLAGAVRPEQRGEPAARRREVDAGERLVTPVAHHQCRHDDAHGW